MYYILYSRYLKFNLQSTAVIVGYGDFSIINVVINNYKLFHNYITSFIIVLLILLF